MHRPAGRIIFWSLFVSLGAAPLVYSAGNAVLSQIHALEQQEKAQLDNINQQMAELKQKHQSEIAPLQ